MKRRLVHDSQMFSASHARASLGGQVLHARYLSLDQERESNAYAAILETVRLVYHKNGPQRVQYFRRGLLDL